MISENIRTIPAEEFPLLLGKSIYRPKTLYAIGRLPATGGDCGVALVGTRRPGPNARELCRRLVASLKGTDAVVVSGLAQGIDSLCHEAALDARIPTVAVLAQGLATRIEGSRGDLARRILDAGGALVSIFEPDEPAYKGNFIARNKIISGLCRATVVVQSKVKGGALITADFCRDEGKPLLAVPGDFDSEVASGTNSLLDSRKALPVFLPESLCTELGLPKQNGLSLNSLAQCGCSLSPEATEFFKKMNGYRKSFSELEEAGTFNTSQLLTILTELEIAGLVHTEDNIQFQFNGAV